MDSGDLCCDAIDVFCERGVFEVADSEKILEAGKNIGLLLNFHGEELTQIGGAEMGARLGALAISHLEEISDEGIAAMAAAGSVAVLLPTTCHLLRLKAPPARKMIDAGVAIALGTDFNPNAHCLSLPFVMNLACIQLRMTMEEALVAATINSAAALGKAHLYGSIEKGKVGSLVIVDAPRWEHLAYQMVDPPLEMVIVKGQVVYRRK